MNKVVKIFYLVVIFLNAYSLIYSQTVTWQKEYPDSTSIVFDGYSAVQLEDNGYIVVSDRVVDVFGITAMRLDKFGNIIWRKYYEGRRPRTIVKTNDGNFLIGANVLTKINIDGAMLWRRPNSPSYRINLADDGGFYFCAAFPVGPIQSIPSIKKYNSLGFLEWEKIYSDEIYRGGFSNCLIDKSKNLVLIGSFPNRYYLLLSFYHENRCIREYNLAPKIRI
ncbi:MAG: hypothetical protein IPL53_02430 [Ignavibacteria bacterium]|nr:hypothetical protein [Ignavibacteria bacterium]